MRVHVRVPATSANLGPGFDVLGLALALHNDVDAEEADGVSVVIEGEGAGRLETGARNVVARAVRMAFEAAGRPFRGVALRCVNRIPPSRGLGSSAAAWMGGLVAGNALAGGGLSRDTLLELATRAEGHPDNVAAALLGGLTVSCRLRRPRGRAVAAGAARHPMGGAHPGDRGLDRGGPRRARRLGVARGRRVQPPARWACCWAP